MSLNHAGMQPSYDAPDLAFYSSLQHEYFEMYADHFGLKPFIKFHHKMVKLEPNDDYDLTGRWKATVQNLRSKELSDEVFDGVMVCTGHHVKPLIPTFKGQEKFKGKFV